MDEQAAQLVTTARQIVVTMPAELDYRNAEHVGQRLSTALRSDTAIVIADLIPTTFSDTVGIQILLGAHHQATARGVDLRFVVSPSGHVQRVLTMCGLDRLVPCYPSVSAALADAPGAAR
jgi:anti-anti-sigma factor